MPLIAWSYLAFAGGLLVWYSGIAILPVAGGLLMVVIILLRPSVETFAMAIVFMAGTIIAMASPPPNLDFRVGRQPPADTGFFERQHIRAAKSIELVFGDNAPMAKALLVADQSEIPFAVKQQYAQSGLIHMLSISGLHVSIIAGSAALLLQVMRVPIRLASFVSLSTLVLYVCLLGFPPSAVRAAVMVGVVQAARLLQRPTSKWASLALGAYFPLIDPPTILKLGYQLSVGGIAALIASSELSRKFIRPHFSGWKQTIANSLLSSTLATVVTAPLVAWTFGQISIIGPLANIVADPVISLLQPMLFLALLLLPFPSAARFVADSAHFPLKVFDGVAEWFAAVPYSAISIAPNRLTVLLSIVMSAAIIVGCCSRRLAVRGVIVAVGAVSAMVWL